MSAVGGRRSADEFSWNGRRGIFYSNLFEVIEVGWGSFIRRWRFADLRLLICNLFEVKKTTDNGLRTTGCRYKLTNNVVSWYRFTESLVYNFSKKDVFLWKNLKR